MRLSSKDLNFPFFIQAFFIALIVNTESFTIVDAIFEKGCQAKKKIPLMILNTFQKSFQTLFETQKIRASLENLTF